MSGTPRLRSSYPSTPGSVPRTAPRSSATSQDDSANKSTSPLPNLPSAPAVVRSVADSLIPDNLVSHPTQRLYATTVYGLLVALCLYDWWHLVAEGTTSVGYFMKWSCIFAIYIYGLPLLQIPWLEWSSSASSTIFFCHAFCTAMLMFRVPLPFEGWLVFFSKILFDRELSISENSVRPASILHNSSLIMGKQIINILPEGSAIMNPDNLPFCVNNANPSVVIPIRFNQTSPMHVELLRFDLDTNSNETITLSSKERKRRYEDKEHTIATMLYTAKKPGVYRLLKVVDESRLEVQRRMSDTIVVNCPKVAVTAAGTDRCVGDLSDLTMEIEGTAPLKVVYTRTAHKEESTHHFQGIQPENFVSPLIGSANTETLSVTSSPDFAWARTQRIKVPLNESMTSGGVWMYSIDEIHDATGNVANYSARNEDGEHTYPKGLTNMQHHFTVHYRPIAQLKGCDSSHPLKIASGKDSRLPIEYFYPGTGSGSSSHTLTWKFSPKGSLTASGDHGDSAIVQEFVTKTTEGSPRIKEPGLYTLIGVKSQHCEGEVREPASCLLINPPEPSLSISSENINDKCAGNSIGLLVDLDLIGTPPFVVRYEVVTQHGKTQMKHINVDGLRHQLELKPTEAGHFTYRFIAIDDGVYKGHQLTSPGLTLQQDVKPPASAKLKYFENAIDACIEEPVTIEVELFGEKPFTLEYELVHGGHRKKSKVKDIDTNIFQIQTDKLDRGGDYSLSLASVQDKTGCKIHLNSEVKFAVRHQRPKLSFGHLDGKHKTTEIEGRKVKLPLRLTGRPSWSIQYRNMNDTSGTVRSKTVYSNNDFIMVSESGVYELLQIADDKCPGTVNPLASKFEVEWLPRPTMKVADTAVLISDGEKYVKREICEGDIDAVEVNFIGSSPFHLKYQIIHKTDHGPATMGRDIDAALGAATIPMVTNEAGTYEYRFLELSDALYEHDSKKFTPVILEQKVNRKPTATFAKPGQSYKYCSKELTGDDIIPIKLHGTPPFSLEIDIKHQSSSRPESVKIANIETHMYDFRIPHEVLSLGIHHVSVRKVRDFKGCQQKTEYGAPSVQVQVYDVPTIYPVEARTDYCVGERISYTLSGMAPFEIFYDFESKQRKAKSPNTHFRRIAEKPGTFTITAVSDKASECKARTALTKVIHEMPSVKISKGRQLEVDIHEGGEAQILFEFWGTPPFEFTYTRSTNAKRGQQSRVLETRHEVSDAHSKIIQSSQEGTYEVVAIKDKYCSFSTQQAEIRKGQKLLQF